MFVLVHKILKCCVFSAATKLLEGLLAVMLQLKDDDQELPNHVLMQILSKELAHLDTRNFEDVDLPDLMYQMRAAGVEKLKSFKTHTCGSYFNHDIKIRVQDLVPNERLSALNVQQFHCGDDQLAALAIHFPLLSYVTLFCKAFSRFPNILFL